jgi:gliding motility-associated-like protein
MRKTLTLLFLVLCFYHKGSSQVIDLGNIRKLSSPCGKTEGNIVNVLVTGTGRLDYRWLDQHNAEKAKGTLIGSEAALWYVGPGYYRLEIKDQSGHPPVISEEIEVTESSGFSIDESLAVSHDEDCSYDNGSITGIAVHKAKSMVWVDEDGKPAGTTEANGDLTGAKAGKYHLVATDDYECTRESHVFEIKGPVRITYSVSAKVIDVACDRDKGSIELGNGGADEPLGYRWVDADGDNVGTGLKLEAGAGVYTLFITDINHCERFYATYPIRDITQSMSAPLINDVRVCGTGPVAIQVSNAQPGTYYLYNAAGIEMGQSTSGLFNLNLSESGTYTIRLQDGNCESPPATFSISAEQGALSNIANSFSPNGDGKNDLWAIPGLASNPDAAVSIFNRQGEAVFKSVGYKQPFDGRYQGADLPIGVYYYVIDLKRSCGVLTGSLTLIR